MPINKIEPSFFGIITNNRMFSMLFSKKDKSKKPSDNNKPTDPKKTFIELIIGFFRRITSPVGFGFMSVYNGLIRVVMSLVTRRQRD